jgi:hypothetical protein
MLMIPMKHIAILLSLLITGPLLMATDRNQANDAKDATIVEIVLRSEIDSNHFTSKDVVCLSTNGYRDPRGELLTALRAKKFRVNPGSWCTSGPQGYLVQVAPISFLGSYDATVEVKAVDERRNLVDFPVIMRQGTYSLRLEKGAWRVVKYDQSCCAEGEKRRADVSRQ